MEPVGLAWSVRHQLNRPVIEGLERFVRREPLRRVHECVFGVLALESEPVDPKLVTCGSKNARATQATIGRTTNP